MKHFVEKLTEIQKDILEKMNVNKPMDELTYEQKINLDKRPTAPYVIRNSNLMMRKSTTTATSQVNTEAHLTCKM